MKSTQKDIELLDAYMKGSLDEHARAAFENRMSTEQDLSDDHQMMKVLVQGMRVQALDEKLKMLRDFEGDIKKKDDQKLGPAIKKVWSWWKWMMGVFVLSGMLYLAYAYFGQTEKKIPEEYKILYADRFDSELILHKTMRATVQTDSLSTEQRRAYELYSIQLFDDAIPLLKDLWETRKDTLALFYLGVSEIGSGQKDKGLGTLKSPELNRFSNQINIFIHH